MPWREFRVFMVAYGHFCPLPEAVLKPQMIDYGYSPFSGFKNLVLFRLLRRNGDAIKLDRMTQLKVSSSLREVRTEKQSRMYSCLSLRV